MFTPARRIIAMPNPIMSAINNGLKELGCEGFMIQMTQDGLMLITDECVDPRSPNPRHVTLVKELGLYKGPHGSDYVILEDHPGIVCGRYICATPGALVE